MSEISQDTVRLSQAWGASFGDYNYVKWDGSVKTRFDSDAKGTDRKGTLKQSSYETLQEVFGDQVDFTNLKMTKSEVEYWLQMVKSKIDSLNNEANKDMTRLESLVDRRDEAYSTASDLMSKVSDTRSTLIGNL
ncbi:MAG: hypothetical protein IKC15_03260 [Kiritimatiellae bacterium]|nr:hypothetical protein [Kiritimatiellia bacterium]